MYWSGRKMYSISIHNCNNENAKDGKRYIVFLYVANQFSGELKSSSEGDIFRYPLSQLYSSDKLIDGFDEMLSVFTKDEISEVIYERLNDEWNTVFC